MVKQLISVLVLVALSLAILLAMPIAQHAIMAIVTAHDWVSETLKSIFSGGQAGNLIRELLALLTVPVLLGLIPMLIYWIIKRTWFPYFMTVVWVIWLLQTAAIVVLLKV